MAEDQTAWRERLAGVGARPAVGTWYRMVPRAYRDQAHSDEGSRFRGGRYNPPGKFGGLYLSDSAEACRAELLRHADVLPDLSLGTFDVSLSHVLDLTDAAVRQRLGVSHEDLTQDNHSLTREIGEAAFDAGFEGILFPSAAGPHTNLVIFTRNRRPNSRLALQNVRNV